MTPVLEPLGGARVLLERAGGPAARLGSSGPLGASWSLVGPLKLRECDSKWFLRGALEISWALPGPPWALLEPPWAL